MEIFQKADCLLDQNASQEVLASKTNKGVYLCLILLAYTPGKALEKTNHRAVVRSFEKAFSWKISLGTFKIRKRIIFVP